MGHVDLFFRGRHGQDSPGHPIYILGGKAGEDVVEGDANPFFQVAHDAEVDEENLPFMDDEIAGMGVSMEITVLKDLLDKAEHEFLPHIFQIIASSQQFLIVVDTDAWDVGFYQHLTGGKVLKNLWNADAGDVGIFSGKIPEMLGLVAEINLRLDGCL